MELYILDDLLRRVNVIDRYESLIWAERYNKLGDFEMEIYSTLESRQLLTADTLVTCNLSDRLAKIDSVENKEDEDGMSKLIVKGRSYEYVLDERVAREALTSSDRISKGTVTLSIASPGLVTKTAHNLLTSDQVYLTTTGALPTGLTAGTTYFVIKVTDNTFRLATTEANATAGTAINFTGTQSGVHTLHWINGGRWRLTGTPGDIVRNVFKHICVDGALSTYDILPFIQSGIFSDPGSIPEPDEVVTVELPITSVLSIVESMCDAANLGFRIIRNGDSSELYFEVYTGHDRTSGQDDRAAVIFSPSLDNLTSINQFTSTVDYKNFAYVFSKNGYAIVNDTDVTPETVGRRRRVMYVDASDIELAAGASLTSALEQRGRETLATQRNLIAFDGEIPQVGSYVYKRDYNLGDIVEMRTSDGFVNNMRVVEQIFIEDSSGERSYPTLAIDVLITPGSWASWEFNREWADFTTEEWADLP